MAVFALLNNFSFMISQQGGMLEETPLLDTMSVLSHFPRTRTGTEWVKLCKQRLLQLETAIILFPSYRSTFLAR